MEDFRNTRNAFERGFSVSVKPIISTFFPARWIPIEELGQFAVENVKGRWEGETRVFSNLMMRDLVKELK
jgi:hypothetical protein